MNTTDLKNYLSRVYGLEVLLYQENALVKAIKNKIYPLEHWRPDADESSSSFWNYFRNSENGVFIYPLVGLAFIAGMYKTFMSVFFSGNNVYAWIQYPLVIGIISFSIICSFTYVRWQKKEQDTQKRNLNIKARNKIQKEKNEQQLAILNNELSIVQRERQRTSAALQQYYAKNIIYSKYRNLVAVSSFLDYLQAGNCTALEGPNGAYNKFDIEIRLGVIIQKLDDIITHLDRIENNQYMLYSAIQQSNQNTAKMSSELAKATQHLQQIQNCAEITAYNSRITAQNTEFIKWIEYYR